MDSDRYIGLISGTSRDGVDAVLVRMDGHRPVFEQALSRPYPADVLNALHGLPSDREPDATTTAGLHRRLADCFADSALALLRQARLDPAAIRAIGSHGQTVWHAPDADPPRTLQLGDGRRIARATGIVTVSDFRRADLEAGGQAAPLAPLLHRECFHDAAESRAVLNLGGISNLTLLGADGSVAGFDCGPANALLDAWARRHLSRGYDDRGQWGASGAWREPLMQRLQDDPWFGRTPPKSTGIEHFSPAWLDARLDGGGSFRPQDVQATLAEHAAWCVAEHLRRFAPFRPARVLACGGGVHNRDLMRRIQERLKGIPVESTAAHGIDPDWVEGMLFAWLAQQRLANIPQDTPPITGARKPELLGRVDQP